MVGSGSRGIDEITKKMEDVQMTDHFIITGDTTVGDGRPQLASLAATSDAKRLQEICENFPTAIPWRLDLPGWTLALARVGQGAALKHLVAAFDFLIESLESQHSAEMQAKQEELEKKDRALSKAGNQLEELRSLIRGGAAVTATPRQGLAAEPPLFSGSEPDARKRYDQYVTWRGKVLHKLRQDKFLFPTQASRIMYVGGRLDGDAWSSLEEKIERVSCSQEDESRWPWENAEQFLAELDAKYMTHDAVAAAQRDLDLLQQKDKYAQFANFITRFTSLAEKAHLDYSSRVRLLREKVHEKIRDGVDVQVVQPERDDWEGWVQLITKLANNREAADFYKNLRSSKGQINGGGGGNTKNGSSGSGTTGAAHQNNDPMDLDRLNVNRISPEEMKYRITNNLCKRCGGQGHYAVNCTAESRPTLGGRGRGRGGVRGSSQQGGRGQTQQYGTWQQQHGAVQSQRAWVRQMEAPWQQNHGPPQAYNPQRQFSPHPPQTYHSQHSHTSSHRSTPPPTVTSYIEEIYDEEDQYEQPLPEQGNGQPLR